MRRDSGSGRSLSAAAGPKGRHQVRGLNIQGPSELLNSVERGRALRPFDEGDRGPVQSGTETELLLREATGEADLPHTQTEILGEWARFHWPNGREASTNSLHTSRHICSLAGRLGVVRERIAGDERGMYLMPDGSCSGLARKEWRISSLGKPRRKAPSGAGASEAALRARTVIRKPCIYVLAVPDFIIMVFVVRSRVGRYGFASTLLVRVDAFADGFSTKARHSNGFLAAPWTRGRISQIKRFFQAHALVVRGLSAFIPGGDVLQRVTER